MLHLHHADQFDPLVEAAARVLAQPLADPFTPEVVAVPTVGVRDALVAGLGRHLGVAPVGAGAGVLVPGAGVVANVDFVFPGTLVARAFGATGAADTDPWSLARLTWVVLAVLESDPSLLPAGVWRGTDRWALARHIADLFDRYATQRPHLVALWAAGTDGDGTYAEDDTPAPLDAGQRWQARVWRAARARIGVPSPAERLPSLLDDLAAGAIDPGLPGRVSAFGFASVAPATLRVLRALAAVRDVHLFVRHPSATAWMSATSQGVEALTPRARLDVATHVTHPLLASWGRPALETRVLTRRVADSAEHHAGSAVGSVVGSMVGSMADAAATSTVATGEPVSAPAGTLLAALQQGIRRDLAPARQVGVDPADGTVQVHACHGEVRQLEVLRDTLGHAFVADPTLGAHDVVVLCPDLERFAPLVEAVFARGDLPVPVRVGDRALTSDEPVGAAFTHLLALVSGRCTLSEVLTFLQREPVRLRRGWTHGELEQLATWATTLGVRWGLQPEQRLVWGLPGNITTGTWRAAADSLLAGVALQAPTPRLVLGGVAPHDAMGRDEVELAGELADLLARLVDLNQAVGMARPAAGWAEVLHAAADSFLATESDERWRLQALHRAVDDLVAAADGATMLLDLDDVRAALGAHLDEMPGRLPLRSGAVTVSSLLPQRGVPARIVCLLGLDEAPLRVGTFDGDDVLGVRPCVGERHPRHEQRHLLLDAVLAARERLIVTCDGFDVTTNHELPFAVPLVELLAVLRVLAPLADDAAPVVVRHPRHGFAERALRPGALVPGATAPFTFDRAMLDAARARRNATAAARSQAAPAAHGPWWLEPRSRPTVDVSRLVEAVTRPARLLLRDRLDVSVPGDADLPDDGLAIGLDPLEASSLGRALLDARRAGATVDEWRAAARLDGKLPPAALATAVLDGVCEAIAAVEGVAAQWTVPLTGTGRLPIDVTLPPAQVPGLASTPPRIIGELAGLDGRRLVRVRYVRHRRSHLLGAAVELAVAQLQDPDTDWCAVVVDRGDATKVEAVGLRLHGAGTARREHALAVLEMAVRLNTWASHDAVPYLDRVSAALANGNWGAADGELERDLLDVYNGLLFGGLTLEALRGEAVHPDDPEVVRRHDAYPRAEAVARWVWDTFDGAVERVQMEAVSP